MRSPLSRSLLYCAASLAAITLCAIPADAQLFGRWRSNCPGGNCNIPSQSTYRFSEWRSTPVVASNYTSTGGGSHGLYASGSSHGGYATRTYSESGGSSGANSSYGAAVSRAAMNPNQNALCAMVEGFIQAAKEGNQEALNALSVFVKDIPANASRSEVIECSERFLADMKRSEKAAHAPPDNAAVAKKCTNPLCQCENCQCGEDCPCGSVAFAPPGEALRPERIAYAPPGEAVRIYQVASR